MVVVKHHKYVLYSHALNLKFDFEFEFECITSQELGDVEPHSVNQLKETSLAFDIVIVHSS